MSRDLTDLGYYVMRGGQIPVKWTAPEAILFRKYSTSSDVWSLGMVFFEVWSLGWKPFDNFSTDQVRPTTGGPLTTMQFFCLAK